MERFDMGQNEQRKLTLRRRAGDSASSGTDTQTTMVLRTEGQQRWREAQRKHSSKWNGVY